MSLIWKNVQWPIKRNAVLKKEKKQYIHNVKVYSKKLQLDFTWTITLSTSQNINSTFHIVKYLKELYTMNIRICFVPSLSWTETTIFALSECSVLFSSTPTTEDCNELLISNFDDSSTSFNNSFADSANQASSCFFNLHVWIASYQKCRNMSSEHVYKYINILCNVDMWSTAKKMSSSRWNQR